LRSFSPSLVGCAQELVADHGSGSSARADPKRTRCRRGKSTLHRASTQNDVATLCTFLGADPAVWTTRNTIPYSARGGVGVSSFSH
jgi:hypothetical protein